MTPWHRVALDALCLALAPATALTLVLVHNPGVRFGSLLLALLLVPGTALISRLELRTLSQTLGIAVTSGVSVSAVGTLIMIWLRWFEPRYWAMALAAISELLLAVDLRRRLRAAKLAPLTPPSRVLRAAAGPDMWLPWIPLIAGFMLWIISLRHIVVSHIGVAGLLGAAPITWYLALGVLIFGALVTTAATPVRSVLMALYVTAVAVVLLGTMPAIVSAPMFSYVYKHISVIAFMVRHGQVGPTSYIYNRWPTFFALAAALTRMTGLSPIAYANWAMPFFSTLNALMIAGITQTLTGSRRAAAFAALLFTCANWIGQTYLSPQAFAFMLYGGTLLLAFSKLGTATPSAIAATLGRPFTRHAGRNLHGRFAASVPGQRALAFGLILVVDFVIASAHQLTPYALLVQLCVCVALGLVAGYGLAAATAAITIGYLLPNLAFIERHYGIFTSISLVSLLSVTGQGPATHRAAIYADAGTLLTMVLLAVTFACAAVLVRAGRAQKAIPLLLLASAPVVLLLAGDYGGEGPLRVFLFSSPWQCALIAYTVTSVGRRVLLPLSTLITAPVVALCMLSFLGNAGAGVIPSSEVRAENYLEAHVPSSASVFLAGYSFPFATTPNYPRVLAWSDEEGPLNLFAKAPGLVNPRPPATILSTVVRTITTYGGPPYLLVFARSADNYSSIYRVASASVMAALRTAISTSPAFRLYYSNPDTWVYELR